MEDIVAEAREQGYVSTLMGRRRYLDPEIRKQLISICAACGAYRYQHPIQNCRRYYEEGNDCRTARAG